MYVFESGELALTCISEILFYLISLLGRGLQLVAAN